MLEANQFDEFVEGRCAKFYAAKYGRPSLTPGIYFRSLLIGYFEGIDGERGIAWRMADSLALRRFVGISLDSKKTPDHSTISRTRRLIDLETHREVFAWALAVLADRGLLKGQRIAIDATTLEGERRHALDCAARHGGKLRGVLVRVATLGQIETPNAGKLARLDRKRKKRMSNKEWKSPSDQDARIAKMKDGRTHLAHKAEHAVDLDTGAVVAITLQGADQGDTTTLDETLSEAGMAVAELVGREAEQRPDEKPKVTSTGSKSWLPTRTTYSGAVVQRVKSYEVRSEIPGSSRKAVATGGQRRRTTGGVPESTAGARRIRQEFTAATRRVGGT